MPVLTESPLVAQRSGFAPARALGQPATTRSPSQPCKNAQRTEQDLELSTCPAVGLGPKPARVSLARVRAQVLSAPRSPALASASDRAHLHPRMKVKKREDKRKKTGMKTKRNALTTL